MFPNSLFHTYLSLSLGKGTDESEWIPCHKLPAAGIHTVALLDSLICILFIEAGTNHDCSCDVAREGMCACGQIGLVMDFFFFLPIFFHFSLSLKIFPNKYIQFLLVGLAMAESQGRDSWSKPQHENIGNAINHSQHFCIPVRQ